MTSDRDPAGTADIRLPPAKHISALSVEQTMRLRRSTRDFSRSALPLADLAQVLWSAQGVTGVGNLRTAPSAGELYPVSVYVAAGNVAGLASGIYRYEGATHTLRPIGQKDQRETLAQAALNQEWVRTAPVVLVLTIDSGPTIAHYGERGQRYVLMEAGHVTQNIHLQAAALQLGTVLVGAFSDQEVKQALSLPTAETPVCLVPVGPMI